MNRISSLLLGTLLLGSAAGCCCQHLGGHGAGMWSPMMSPARPWRGVRRDDARNGSDGAAAGALWIVQRRDGRAGCRRSGRDPHRICSAGGAAHLLG